jgi:ferric iron reductase protein FhuF
MTIEPSASTDHSQENPSSAETYEDEAGSMMSQFTGTAFMKEWDRCDAHDCESYKTLVDKYGKWTLAWSKRYFNLVTSPILASPEDREAQLQSVLRKFKEIEAQQHDDEKLATSTWQTFEDDELE